MFQRAETLRQGWIADHVARTALGLSKADHAPRHYLLQSLRVG